MVGLAWWVRWGKCLLTRATTSASRQSHAERVSAFLEHGCLNFGVHPGTASWDPAYPDHPKRWKAAARILARHPEVGRDSIHAAVVSGDLEEVERILAERPKAATQKGEPQRWGPLLYLCYARLPVAAARHHGLTIARRLLDRGADPNESFTDGENRFAPLTGVIGSGEQQAPSHPEAEALAILLLERGAEPYDRQALYNTSLHQDDDRWLQLLYAHAAKSGAPVDWNDGSLAAQFGNGTLDYLLGNAVVRNHTRRAEWLLKHGAHAAAPHGDTKRNLHDEAELRGLTEMAALLRRYGAAPGRLAL